MKIDANIISYGTELYGGSSGYMAITEKFSGFRYIVPVSHDNMEIDAIPDGSLKINSDLYLDQIVVSRFQLMTALFLKFNNISKKSKILIVGMGMVGFACYIEFKRQNFKNVKFCNQKHKRFSVKPNQLDDLSQLEQYRYIIDCTGSNSIISDILNSMKPFQKLVLLGTPRQGPSIESLSIHRNNFTIIGAHELKGYSNEIRQEMFNEIVSFNKKNNKRFENQLQIIAYDDYNGIEKIQREKTYIVLNKNFQS